MKGMIFVYDAYAVLNRLLRGLSAWVYKQEAGTNSPLFSHDIVVWLYNILWKERGFIGLVQPLILQVEIKVSDYPLRPHPIPPSFYGYNKTNIKNSSIFRIGIRV